jgi:hypothetical protein
VIPLGEVLDALLNPFGILRQFVVSYLRRSLLHWGSVAVLLRSVVYDLDLGFAFNFNLKFFRRFLLLSLDLVRELEFGHVNALPFGCHEDLGQRLQRCRR